MTRIVLLLLLLPALLGLPACTVTGSRPVVTVLSTWTGAEEAEFTRVLDAFTAKTGIRVDHQGTRAVSQVLRSQVLRGAPPDVAILASPAILAKYARGGQLRPLNTVIGRQRDAYAEQWLLPRHGKIYTVPIKVNVKSLIWFNPAHFPTPPKPRTWAELTELTRKLAARGGSPWCLGMGDAPSSGWPGSDMIESILLHRFGPGPYGQWAAGGLPWVSAEVRDAWQAWGEITASSRTGPGALLADFGDSGRPMFTDPPRCFLEHQASFVMGVYQGYTFPYRPAPEPGKDFDFFPVPAFGGPKEDPASREWEVSADLAGLFTDRPEAQRLIQFLATEEAQQIWPATPGASAFTANARVAPSIYDDVVSGNIAQIIQNAGTLCLDAADVMPEVVRNAFYQAVLEYLNDPTRLDELLERLDTVSAGVPVEEWLSPPCGP